MPTKIVAGKPLRKKSLTTARECDARHTPRPRSSAPIPADATAAQLRELCAVSSRTARRWRAQGRMPAKLAAWVALNLEGDLGVLAGAWRGWRIVRGELYGPDLVHGFTPGDVLGIPFTRAIVRNYQLEARVRALELERAALPSEVPRSAQSRP